MVAKLLPFLLSVVVLSYSATAGFADAEPRRLPVDNGAVIQAFEALAEALRGNDSVALEPLLADDFMLIDHEGKSDTKASLLKAIKDGILVFRSLELGLPKPKESGNAGVVQGLIRLHVTYGRAKPIEITDRFAVTTVFVKHDGAWRLIAAQMTTIKPKQ